MATSRVGLAQHTLHVSSPHSKPGKNWPLWTYNLRQLTDRYIRPIARIPKLLACALAVLLYFLYKYIRTRSCRRRGCQRHNYRSNTGIRYAPRDLCIDRKRSLTPPPEERWYHHDALDLPFGSSSSSKRRKQYDQVQSPLFARLPGEIRAIIYEYAIAGRTLRVEQRFKRMMCTPVIEEESPYRPLDLLVTCRKIYAEAIEILYARNILVMREPLTYLDFTATVLHKRLEAVRYLVFCFKAWECLTEGGYDSSQPLRWRLYADRDTWDAIWESIQMNFKGLRTVAVCIDPTDGPPATAPTTVFEPLLKVSDRVKVLVTLDSPTILEGNVNWARNAQFTVQHCGNMSCLGRELDMDLRDLKRLDDDTTLPYSLGFIHQLF